MIYGQRPGRQGTTPATASSTARIAAWSRGARQPYSKGSRRSRVCSICRKRPDACSTLCRQSVEQASGRFLHIEQTRDLRDPFEYGWRAPRDHAAIRAVLDAVAGVVPCLPGRCP